MDKNKSDAIESILRKLLLLIPFIIMMYLASIGDGSWRVPIIIVTIIGYIIEFFILRFWIYRKKFIKK